jgi:hypothetical protein
MQLELGLPLRLCAALVDEIVEHMFVTLEGVRR